MGSQSFLRCWSANKKKILHPPKMRLSVLLSLGLCLLASVLVLCPSGAEAKAVAAQEDEDDVRLSYSPEAAEE